jgi:hypothetical protein
MRSQLIALNYEAECAHDLAYGMGFMITDEAYTNTSKTETNIDGPQSERYGTTYGDEFAFVERHRCECGELTGAMFMDEICPKCKTVVKNRGIDITKTGWLTWDPYKIIAPRYYRMLAKAIGETTFINMLSHDNKRDANGNIRDIHEDYVAPGPRGGKSGPYYNIGMVAFYENYEEILEYFSKKRKDREFDKLLRDKAKVFTSVFPLYSTVLRPTQLTGEDFHTTDVNMKINPICRIMKFLVGAVGDDVDIFLSAIQEKCNDIWDICYSMIEQKKGTIRSQIIGGTYNWTARNVIVLDQTLDIDEVDIGFPLAMEFYKSWIIREIMDDRKIPLTAAFNIVDNSYEGGEYIYSIVQRAIDKHKPKLIIDRNPSLHYKSIVRVRIRNVIMDPTLLCLSIGTTNLEGLNADLTSKLRSA